VRGIEVNCMATSDSLTLEYLKGTVMHDMTLESNHEYFRRRYSSDDITVREQRPIRTRLLSPNPAFCLVAY
jgi:hypothetical protein